MSRAKYTRREPKGLLAARMVAQREIAEHYPQLAEVDPMVTSRRHRSLPGNVLARAGLTNGQIVFRPHHAPAEYIFTFRAEMHTSDGYTTPYIACVTVDARQRVVKTILSK